MERAAGLRIALLTHDSLGNYVVATPLMAMLRRGYPQARIEYVGGRRTAALWRDESGWDAAYDYEEAPDAAYDLVVTTERDAWAVAHARRIVAPGGRILGPGSPEPEGLAVDPDWTARDLRARYPEIETGFITEIYARCAGLSGPVGPYVVPREPAEAHGCGLIISCSASLDEKLWPLERWREALELWRSGGGGEIGLVGVKPKPGANAYCGQTTEDALAPEVRDLRGRYSLPQLVDALDQARVILTIDNGIMHLAAANDRPIVALFREGIDRLWNPPLARVSAIAGEPVAGIPASEVGVALAGALQAPHGR